MEEKINLLKNKIIKEYEFLDIIGKGSFSYIFKIYSIKYNKNFVAKVLLTEKQNTIITFKSEYNSLLKLNHPNIIRLYDFFEFEDYFIIILEYCKNYNLFEKIIKEGPLNINKFLIISKQIIEALNYSHQKGIAHLDIKPQNILFDEYDRPKLADFGFSIENENLTKKFQGSLEYLAPEILLNKSYDPFLADIWSLGITLYYSLIGKLPFDILSHDQYKKHIDILSLMFPTNISFQCQNLLKSIIQIDPKNRLSLENLLIFYNNNNLLKKNQLIRVQSLKTSNFKFHTSNNKKKLERNHSKILLTLQQK